MHCEPLKKYPTLQDVQLFALTEHVLHIESQYYTQFEGPVQFKQPSIVQLTQTRLSV
jgi:hypothetical protein